MKRLLLSAAAAIAISSSAGAVDITGTYAIVGENHCVSGVVGAFNSLQEILSGAAGIGTTRVAGFVTFEANGSGSATLTEISTFESFSGGRQVGAWLDTATGKSTFTYTVTGDEYVRTFTSDVSTFTTGNRTGQTNTITGNAPFNGVASENIPHVLLEANSQPTLQTWMFSNGDVANAFCSAFRTLTKVRASDATN